ncbi:MAG: hypothetical protein A2622_04185 [Bdellovibrionales bacterium RIFCSPHIGHO2_01_FULL_40_29]|nr:MAG: hypothetical protein A2622_04185 [Bdellovibrionales bacterium RIFCSPHIGHO2_01_FULL_40_29]OFZ34863.1 MAG: hypothetical protein A3D17_11190 [Bdellovibrionales bacterium RIFCSPHIGHO2_02_FULL_40_15]
MKKALFVLTIALGTRAFAQVTISGISSGGFMATQMGVIYSEEISGVGTVAGGFFYCAQNHLQNKIQEGIQTHLGKQNLFLFNQNKGLYSDLLLGRFLFPGYSTKWFTPSPMNPIYQSVGVCMQNPDKAELPDLKAFHEKKLIDDPSYLTKQNIFTYHGEHDNVVLFKMAQKIKDFYIENKIPIEQIQQKSLQFAGHSFATDKQDLQPCTAEKFPFITSCQYDLAFDLLTFLTKKELKREPFEAKNLYYVDQTLDLKNLDIMNPERGAQPTPSIAPYGYLYSSNECLQNPTYCQLHVALHGCEMSDSFDIDFDAKYTEQVQKTRIVEMRKEKSKILGFKSLPYIKQKKIRNGTFKFAQFSGYSEYAIKNNIMILYPQTWITEDNYPYNPKGCWDWFGWTNENYATNQGLETSWLMQLIRSVKNNPTQHLLKIRPQFKK